MNRLVHLSAGVTVLCLVLMLGHSRDGSSQAASLKIAVVNIKDVFAQYQKAKDFEDALEAEAKDEKEQMDRVEKDLNDLKQEIDVLEATSALRKEKIEKFISQQAVAKFKVEEWNNRTKLRLNTNTAVIYNEIRKATDAYCKEAGIDLVFKTETALLDEKSKESANQRVNRRNVLYSSDSLDITKVVAGRLNDDYKKKPK